MRHRWALGLAYDGSGFAGWWRQPGRETVAGALDAALARLGEGAARVVGAARTDAGVHALGQIAHLDLVRAWSAHDLAQALDHHLPPTIVVRAVAEVDGDFHAVHDAGSKTYAYALDLAPQRDPFLAPWSWRPAPPLDPARLAAAVAVLPGTWNLAAFARRGDHRDDHRVTIRRSTWDGRVVRVVLDRATYRLVRSLVGAVVQVAAGGAGLDDLCAALAGRPRPVADHQAPAQGLCLEAVTYKAPLPWAEAPTPWSWPPWPGSGLGSRPSGSGSTP